MDKKNGGYEVKNVRTFIGMEGQGFNATLYKDGKRLGLVYDDASGGEFGYELKAEDEKALAAYVASLPPTVYPAGTLGEDEVTLAVTPDIFMDDLVNTFLADKKLRGWCKTKTVVKVAGSKDGQYTIYYKAFSPAMEAYVNKTLGDSVVEIINKRYL